MKMLESLTPAELSVFNDNLRDVVGLAAPFYNGMTVEQVLRHLAETPGEYCLDEWEPLLRNLGYDHVANRYMPDELLPVIVADMATAPGLPIFWSVLLYNRIWHYDFLITCQVGPDEFPEQNSWASAIHAFGYQFTPDGHWDMPDED